MSSSQWDYVYVPVDEVRHYEMENGDETTMMVDYRPHGLEDWEWCRAQAIRQRECIQRENVPFDANSTSRDDFRQFEALDRAQPIRPQPQTALGSGPFETKSMYRQEFHAKDPEPDPVYKHRVQYIPNPTPFVGQSITSSEFQPYDVPREKSCKPVQKYEPRPEKFETSTTASKDFRAWQVNGLEKPPWAMRKQYEPPSEPFHRHSAYREEFSRHEGNVRAEMLRPRGSNVRIEMPGVPKKTDSSMYSKEFMRYENPEQRPSFKEIRVYAPPTQAVQKESMYNAEFTGRMAERSLPCIPKQNKMKEDGGPDFNTTYRQTFYKNGTDQVDGSMVTAGVASKVNARGTQISLRGPTPAKKPVATRKVIIQRVAAGIPSEKMPRQHIPLRTSAPPSRNLDRPTQSSLLKQRQAVSRRPQSRSVSESATSRTPMVEHQQSRQVSSHGGETIVSEIVTRTETLTLSEPVESYQLNGHQADVVDAEPRIVAEIEAF